MRNRYLFLIAVILGLVVGLAVINALPPAVTAADSDGGNQLHASGSGEVKADPDQVEVSLGVEVTRETAQETREENAMKTSQVVRALNRIGLTDDQIETVRFTIFPEREYIEEKGGSEVVGYRAVNIIKVTSGDTEMAANIIDTAVANGANTVEGVSFTLKEATIKELRKEAVKLAVRDVENEAMNAANEMGVNLGPPTNIDVTSSGPQPFVVRYEMAGDAKATIEAETPIMPGKVTVRAIINVVYSFN